MGALLLSLTAAPAVAQFTISGTVTDPVAAPVDSVDIKLFDNIGTPIGIPPTMTNASGFYSIVGLPPGSYQVAFEPPAQTKLLPKTLPATVTSSNVTLNAQLDPGFLISGFVTDTTGTGIFNIDFNAFDRDLNMVINTPGDNTDINGFYDVVVPAGRYDFKWRAVAPGLPPYIPVEIRNINVSTDMVFNITMVIGHFVSGIVRDSGGLPVVNANLDFIDAATGVKLDTPGDITDLTGAYQVQVPAALYDVRVKLDSTSTLAPGQVLDFPVSADTTLDFTLQPGLLLSGTIKDPSGFAVANVDLDVRDVATGVKLYTPGDVTDALGNYGTRVPAGTYRLDYQPPVATKLAPVRLDNLPIATDLPINLTLQAGVWLSGTVTNGIGQGVAGVDIDVKWPIFNIDLPLVGDVTDVLGNFTVTVPSGTYDIEIEPSPATGLAAEKLFFVPVMADTAIAVTLQNGFHLTGTVTDSVGNPVSNVTVDAFQSGTNIQQLTPGGKTSAAGTYDVVLPPGSFDVVYTPDPAILVGNPVTVAGLTLSGPTVQNVVFQSRVTVDAGDLPGAGRRLLVLRQNHPNPFNPSTRIDFQLGRSGPVSLVVYDARGRWVRTLLRRPLDAGPHEVFWNGTDAHGRRVSSGAYFYRLRQGELSETRKMLLLK